MEPSVASLMPRIITLNNSSIAVHSDYNSWIQASDPPPMLQAINENPCLSELRGGKVHFQQENEISVRHKIDFALVLSFYYNN